MGGISVDARMQTSVPGLLAAGEAVGGANGANRLSGNAITEALVFGRQAGRTASELLSDGHARDDVRDMDCPTALKLVQANSTTSGGANTAALLSELQAVMSADVGPFRTEAGLVRALACLDDLSETLGNTPPGAPASFDPARMDWFDLRNMLLVARVVAEAALRRTESRGAHQREDHPGMLDAWRCNQFAALDGDRPVIEQGPLIAQPEATA